MTVLGMRIVIATDRRREFPCIRRRKLAIALTDHATFVLDISPNLWSHFRVQLQLFQLTEKFEFKRVHRKARAEVTGDFPLTAPR